MGGTAGTSRRRAIDSFEGDNAELLAQTTPEFNVLENDYSIYNPITSFTINNLTASTGDGTFTFGNGVNGTLTIIGSDSAVVQAVDTDDRTVPHIVSKLPFFTPHLGEPPPGR